MFFLLKLINFVIYIAVSTVVFWFCSTYKLNNLDQDYRYLSNQFLHQATFNKYDADGNLIYAVNAAVVVYDPVASSLDLTQADVELPDSDTGASWLLQANNLNLDITASKFILSNNFSISNSYKDFYLSADHLTFYANNLSFETDAKFYLHHGRYFSQGEGITGFLKDQLFLFRNKIQGEFVLDS